MKKIYNKIWQLAKPYYKKGRSEDIEHIKWMMKDALLVCKKEKLDDSILLPLVILHDTGYANVPKNNLFELDIRKTHMKEGEKIAKDILEEVNYSPDKIKKITHFVSVHDNWAFGKNAIYKKHKILGVFTDLDFIWMATPKGFDPVRKYLGKDKKEMIEYLENSDKLKKRPFSCESTKELYYNYLKDRKTNSSTKIYILGPQGSGKTTFAKMISKKLRIPVFSLDDIYWKKKYTIKRNETQKKKSLDKILKGKKKWIIEGLSTSFVDKAIRQAELVIWLDLNHKLLSYRVIKRQFKSMLVGSSSLSGLRKLLGEIKDYKEKKGMYKNHRDLLNFHKKKYIILSNKKDMKELLYSIK
ncbi:hypothetical protein CMI42_00415 [Candidatus Pacearchaeota archaeon]|nr:hypothetical protein [Candidatus Pacearchaeota archaeon]